MEAGETIAWQDWANHWQGIRSVGGRLYLTDLRLIFVPTEIEAMLRGHGCETRLTSLRGARISGMVRTIGLSRVDGETDRFVVSRREETARLIDRAIKAASSGNRAEP